MSERPFQTRATMIGAAGPISYLAAGPQDGPLMIFLHGWPAVAATWQPQLNAFASRGYRVIAPDLRGFGHSFVPAETAAYAQRHIVADMLALLAHLGEQQAIWVGHDWGAATAWALAAHHPDVCTALVALCIPYRTIERGKAETLQYVNRDIYPADKYPDAQFEYMTYYQEHAGEAAAAFDAQPEQYLKVFFRRGKPTAIGTPFASATVARDGGWFGGAAAPDLRLDTNILSETMFDELAAAFRRTGFAGSMSLYRNDDDNLAYSDQSVAGGRIDRPALFVEAGYDAIVDAAVSRLSDPMRDFCGDLTEMSINAGHWVALERPNKVNDTIAHWLRKTLTV